MISILKGLTSEYCIIVFMKAFTIEKKANIR